jgi:hypothetical protein
LGLELDIHDQKLRWFTAEGELIPLPEEQERQRAEQEWQARQRLEEYPRSKGIDPDQLPE